MSHFPNDDGRSNDNDEDAPADPNNNNHPLALLIGQLHAIAGHGGYDGADVVCEIKAQNVLEAAAGDVHLAAQLYWDDFLASQQQHPQQHHRPPLQQPPPQVPPPHRQPYHHFHYPQPDHPSLLEPNVQRRPTAAGQVHFLGEIRGDHPNRCLQDRFESLLNNSANDEPKKQAPDFEVAAEISALRRRLEQSLDEHIDQGDATNAADGAPAAAAPLEEAMPVPEVAVAKVGVVRHSRVHGKKRRRGHRQGSPSTDSDDDDDDSNSSNCDSRDRHKRDMASNRTRRSYDVDATGKAAAELEGETEQNLPSVRWLDKEKNVAALDDVQKGRRLREFMRQNLLQEQAAAVDGNQDHARNNNRGINNDPMLPQALVDVDADANPFQNNDENDFAEFRAAAVAAMAESVSISDDEAGGMGGWRKFNSKKSGKSRKISRKKADDDDMVDEDDDTSPKRKHRLKHSKRVKVVGNNDGDNITNLVSTGNKANADAFTDDDDDDDGYVSDDDWIWDIPSRVPLPALLPVDILWGGIASLSKCPSDETTEKLLPSLDEKPTPPRSSSKKKRKITKKNDAADDDNDVNLDSNVIDDDNDVENTTGQSKDQKASSGRVSIPYTWLNAGFQFSDTKNDSTVGLIIGPPSENDLGYSAWKASDLWRGNARNAIPPPYHCRSITALISIVNGLLYTGSCIPGTGRLNPGFGSIPASSTRQPLAEVTQELEVLEQQHKEKQLLQSQNKHKSKKDKLKDEEDENALNQKRPTKPELESRLADALSSLLVIAIRASAERKLKKLQSFKESKDPARQRHWQMLERKMRLCPTCWWDPEIVQNKSNDASTSIDALKISVSYTNIEDIRSYVVGNLPAFMSSGGCALFMETILRIHGRGAVLRMIRKARKNSDVSSAEVPVKCNENASSANGKQTGKPAWLVFCTCEKRHQENLDSNPLLGRPFSSSNHLFDTTPHSHECISIEMISLLLTGRVHSTLQGWSTSPLGLGVLSNTPGQVVRGLTRPEKPVWILRGPTSYSCMWLNGCNDRSNTFSRIDNPIGTVAVLTHWNCWYGIRNKTKLRVVSNRATSHWNMPSLSTETDAIFRRADSSLFDAGSCNRDRVAVSSGNNMVLAIAKRQKLHEQVASDIATAETVDSELLVTDDELSAVLVHPDDPKFYPGKYRLWRYDIQIGKDTNENKVDAVESNVAEIALGCHDWRPYHRLSGRQQLVVETKLGPKINSIIWTRWPGATIDRYEPEDPPAVV